MIASKTIAEMLVETMGRLVANATGRQLKPWIRDAAADIVAAVYGPPCAAYPRDSMSPSWSAGCARCGWPRSFHQ